MKQTKHWESLFSSEGLKLQEVIHSVNSTDWDEGSHVHNWRNYVPNEIRDMWDQLQLETRLLSYYMAHKAADLEEWE